MHRLISIFILLNIYTALCTWLTGQELQLNISAEISISNSLKDSINPKEFHSDFRSLKAETLRIEDYLQKVGYLETELVSTEPANDSIYIAKYSIGPKYNILKVNYKGIVSGINKLRTINNNNENGYFTIPISEAEFILSKLNDYQIENGNAFAKLKLNNFKKSNDTLLADLIYDGGISRTIDSVIIKGYSKFPKSFIKYFAGIKNGQRFNRNELIKKNSILNNLGFANSNKPPEVLFRENKTNIYLYLEKQNNNTFDGILGFASKENENGLELNGYINLALNNNLNYGEQLLLNYKADGDGQRNFRVKTTLPYILKSPFGVALELKLFRRDSTFSTNEQQIRVLYQARPSTNFFVGYKLNNSSNLQDNQTNIGSIEDFEAKFVLGGVEYRNYQNQSLFPIKSYIGLEIETGERQTASMSDNQTRLQNNIFHIFNLNNRNSFFAQNTTSVLFSENFLTNELFRFGGINSIRGFSENSIDASLFSVLNTEYRYQLASNTYIHSIIDVGYFENEILSQKEKLYSFGIGLGLQTKAGLFKFNFANGNIENQDFKFSNSKIHFSIVTNF